MATATDRRLPIGAELSGGGAHFRVWAPKCRVMDVVINGGSSHSMTCEEDGHFSGLVANVKAGARYQFRPGDSKDLYPDPASRFQPDGVHGPSEVIDPLAFGWTDQNWRGRGAEGQVVYELHVGTFTQEGTWAAARGKLRDLAELGITCVEVMPVAEFAGTFGWGYDGVDFFAPTRNYGRPDDFRKFVDSAHALGVSVILDVVYNHFGPDGNYLRQFADEYFTDKHGTDWGDAINFDDAGSGPVREFFLTNVEYWLTEFHLDGFRFDATHAIKDDSAEHILLSINKRARDVARRLKKEIFLVNENEPNHTRIVRPVEEGGYGMDALWNDDFHHSAVVAMTDRDEAYYSDHFGNPQEFVSVAKWGYLFQGQRYSWQKKRRGTPALDLPPTAFINFIENHDQVGNSASGFRLGRVTSPTELRAMTAVLLLLPQTPMLFQGQEWATDSRFHYFADHNPELAMLVRKGRARELSQFPSTATEPVTSALYNPDDPEVFHRCKLDWDERKLKFNQQILRMHKDLIALRQTEPAFRRVQRRGDVDGATIGLAAFVLRYFGEEGDDRLLIANFGRDIHLTVAPEPLLAPPAGKCWALAWTSEHPDYAGSGTPAPETEQEGWFIQGRCAVVMKPAPMEQAVRTRIVKGGAP